MNKHKARHSSVKDITAILCRHVLQYTRLSPQHLLHPTKMIDEQHYPTRCIHYNILHGNGPRWGNSRQSGSIFVAGLGEIYRGRSCEVTSSRICGYWKASTRGWGL